MANEVDNVMAATTEKETQIVGAFPQIIVTGTAEKPFYQIMYLENEDGDIHLGFGSFDLAYVFQWLKEFFGVTHASAVNPESLRPKGRWELEARSFYRDTFDESCELAVYIVANCSCCGGKHPNYHEVYSKTLYPPDEDDRDYQFDQDEERAKALAEYKELLKTGRRKLANYCPNCGAKMEG